MSVEVPLIKVGSNPSCQSKCVISYDRVVSYRGEPPCVLTFQNSEFGEQQFSGKDIFECLCNLRRFLEEKDWRILCNGACFDAYPSGMSRDMGGGYKLYIRQMGQHPQRSDLVKIFDKTAPEKIGTVEEQLSYYRQWLESVGL
ncbi:MAG: hypothetical protein KME06_09925 [Kastovskya adunca ATA6-11-RM4]|jgi:hypothetical protein|nr:hypothetical protein [Kastovskya adunca ATA6-11-RM4]